MIKSSTNIPTIDLLGGHDFLYVTKTSIYTYNTTSVALRLRNGRADSLTLRKTAHGHYYVRLFKVKGNRNPQIIAEADKVMPIDLLKTVNRIAGLNYEPSMR